MRTKNNTRQRMLSAHRSCLYASKSSLHTASPRWLYVALSYSLCAGTGVNRRDCRRMVRSIRVDISQERGPATKEASVAWTAVVSPVVRRRFK